MKLNIILYFFRVEASLNRSIRAFQDEAFMESLRADQEKERKREEERRAAEAERRRLEEVIFNVSFPFFFIELSLLIGKRIRRRKKAKYCTSKD